MAASLAPMAETGFTPPVCTGKRSSVSTSDSARVSWATRVFLAYFAIVSVAGPEVVRRVLGDHRSFVLTVVIVLVVGFAAPVILSLLRGMRRGRGNDDLSTQPPPE
jgi:hypothetical protein